MGKIKYLKDVENFINSNKVFNVKDVKRILLSRKANPNYAYFLLSNLVKKGKIYRVTQGYYSKYEDPMVFSYCIKPSYIGLETALSLHGLWEQETNVVLITPRRVRTGARKILNTNIIIHSIDKNKFFGYDYIDYYEFKIPVSDIEKTFIDWIFYNKYLDENLLNNFKKKIKIKKLKEYLKNYDKRFVKKVLGILKNKK